ncbi:MAG: hypothetical protein IT337_08775 [Thermomicrobiales bacterium]|nr:hypothetical protein [Thermomicrobiales bacterium]
MSLAATVLAVFALAAAGFVPLNIAWLRDMRESRVVLLGSGDRLSVLVLAGDSRLLIATGDDPIAFGNALERQRRPTQRRLDLAFVAGAGDDVLVPAAVAADPGVRLLAALVPFAQAPDHTVLRGLPALSAPRRIILGDGVVVTLEPIPAADDEVAAWRAIVERNDARIVILSDGSAAGRFSPPPASGLLVIAGGKPLEAWGEAPTIALAHADKAITPRKLRDAAAGGASVPRYDVRVHPGDSVAVRFVESGIALPQDATIALGAAPVAPHEAP